MKKVVTIGGGTGSYMLLSELKKYPELDITAIVTMSDSGGSTGVLRDELGVLPPGDVRQALVALSGSSERLRDLFSYRFSEGGLGGHNFGNLLLSALEKTTGSFEEAVESASEILGITGRVLPATLEDTQLILEKEDGEEIFGEGAIDSSVIQTHKRLFLSKDTEANPEAVQAILEADIAIINPGNFFCSILPNLLISGISEALESSQAKKVYVANLMTKQGHTDNFTVSDYVEHLHKYGQSEFLTHVVYNNQYTVAPELVEKYTDRGEEFVMPGTIKNQDLCLIAEDLLSKEITIQNPSDKVVRSLIRHDSEKLISLILNI